MLARREMLISIERFNNSDNHSIIITAIAMLKTFERFLLSASAESKKINVKQRLYNIRCHSIGKKGIKNIVNITISSKTELLIVKNLFDMFEKKFIFKPIINF